MVLHYPARWRLPTTVMCNCVQHVTSLNELLQHETAIHVLLQHERDCALPVLLQYETAVTRTQFTAVTGRAQFRDCNTALTAVTATQLWLQSLQPSSHCSHCNTALTAVSATQLSLQHGAVTAASLYVIRNWRELQHSASCETARNISPY